MTRVPVLWRQVGTNTDTADRTGAGGLTLSATHASGAVRVFSGGGGASKQRIHIEATGNIGVGTVTPQATLDIYGYTRLRSYSSQPVACTW